MIVLNHAGYLVKTYYPQNSHVMFMDNLFDIFPTTGRIVIGLQLLNN